MLKGLSSTQVAYIAGFIDGDGSIYVQSKPNTSYRYGFQIAPYIVLFQSSKSKENFSKLCSLIGLGYMRERKDGILEYIVNKQDAVYSLIKKIAPYIMLKKKQIVLMLQVLEKKSLVRSKKDFIALMDLVDRFRALNYSKKRNKHKLTP